MSDQLSDAWLGDVATELRLSDRTIPVRVRYPDAYRFDPPADVGTRRSAAPTARLDSARRRSRIRRRAEGELELRAREPAADGARHGRLEDRDLGSAVAEIQTKLAALKLPVGYTYEVGGQYESQRQAFRELLLGVRASPPALVFIILVIQFRRSRRRC